MVDRRVAILGSGAPPPRLHLSYHRLLAEEIRAPAEGALWFTDPRWLAEDHGIGYVHRDPRSGERTTQDLIVYVWHPDGRECGLRIYCGLSRAFLLRKNLEHGWSDVWLLALELAVPWGVLRTGVEHVVDNQRYCPEDIIRRVATAERPTTVRCR